MNNLFQQVDLTITQDWEIIRATYQKAVEKKDTIRNKKPADVFGSTLYDLKELGHLTWIPQLSLDWGLWNISQDLTTLPWAINARQVFQEIHLKSLVWGSSSTTIKRHRDRYGADDKLIECKLVYIVRSDDPDDHNNMYDDENNKHSFMSTPGTAWLIDTAFDHETISNGCREVLQFQFNCDFQQAREFFNQHTSINLDNPQ